MGKKKGNRMKKNQGEGHYPQDHLKPNNPVSQQFLPFIKKGFNYNLKEKKKECQ